MQETKTSKIYNAEIIKNERVSISSHLIEFDCKIPILASPGQFVTIYCDGLTLRRPFSVFSCKDNKIGILLKERGKGTKYIKSLKQGDKIDVAGVFGNGFTIKNKKTLLIGAGIGIAPISFLKNRLNEIGIENLLIAGFLNKSEIINNIEIDKLYTDDGSIGEKGSVLDYLEQVIIDFKPEIIYSCAPPIVLKNVSQIGKKYNIETQISMENVMACAIGVCRGCVIDIIKNGKVQNATVCKDGPVFYGDEVVWQ